MYVLLTDLRAYFKRKYRATRKNAAANNMRFLSKLVKEWGDHTVIYDEKFLRDQQSEALAKRLAQPKKHVLDQMERCHKLTKEYKEANQ